jgi:hypothetical protein
MKTLRIAATATASAALVALTVVPAAAADSTTHTTYPVQGLEVSATSTEGRFVGTVSGRPAGTWYADVVHAALAPSAAITGGSFAMLLDKTAPVRVLGGVVSGGTIERISGSDSTCTDQAYAVHADLRQANGVGTGTVDATLIHHRVKLARTCVVYAATITGTLTLTPAG